MPVVRCPVNQLESQSVLSTRRDDGQGVLEAQRVAGEGQGLRCRGRRALGWTEPEVDDSLPKDMRLAAMDNDDQQRMGMTRKGSGRGMEGKEELMKEDGRWA